MSYWPGHVPGLLFSLIRAQEQVKVDFSEGTKQYKAGGKVFAHAAQIKSVIMND